VIEPPFWAFPDVLELVLDDLLVLLLPHAPRATTTPTTQSATSVLTR
jgi:hypothetical protein